MGETVLLWRGHSGFGRKKAQKAQKSAGVGKDEFPDFKLLSTEIYQKAMFDTGGTKIAQDLSYVFNRECPARFQFDDELLVHEQIGAERAKQGAIFIENVKRDLLPYTQILSEEAVEQTILVDFFDMTMPQVAM